jgi:pyruvate/2-oxoglutarate dehydrogenase complex dihydrolipoamide dehydrogenase (E3) component
VINADYVLVSTKLIPNLSGSEPLKLQLKDKFIFLNEKYETSMKNAYVIGDLIPKEILAYKTQSGSFSVAEILSVFKPEKMVIPTVLYTSPEIAQVVDVFAKGKVAKLPCKANS